MNEDRKRISVLTALIVLFVVLLASYLAYQNYLLSSEDDNLRTTITSLQDSLSYVRSQLNQSNHEYNELLGNYTRTRIVYQNPSSNTSIVIWQGFNAILPPSNIHNRRWIEWELLDTFVNHIHVSSNQTVEFVLFSLNNFLNFFANKSYVTFYDSNETTMSYDFHATQGCANYVLVIINNLNTTANLVPDITATYAPTPFLTGDCSNG